MTAKIGPLHPLLQFVNSLTSKTDQALTNTDTRQQQQRSRAGVSEQSCVIRNSSECRRRRRRRWSRRASHSYFVHPQIEVEDLES